MLKAEETSKRLAEYVKTSQLIKLTISLKKGIAYNPNSTSLINFHFKINNFSDIQHIQMLLETWMIVYHWCFYSLFCQNQEESMLNTFNCAENYLVITLILNLNMVISTIIYFIHKNSRVYALCNFIKVTSKMFYID